MDMLEHSKNVNFFKTNDPLGAKQLKATITSQKCNFSRTDSCSAGLSKQSILPSAVI